MATAVIVFCVGASAGVEGSDFDSTRSFDKSFWFADDSEEEQAETEQVVYSSVVDGALVSGDGDIVFSNLTSEAARDAILNNPTNVIVANAVVRAGGSNVGNYEMAIGEGNSQYDVRNNDVTWDINGPNSLLLEYDGSGSLDLTVNGESISVSPGDWFNEILFSFEVGAADIIFDNAFINGTGFDPLNVQWANNPDWDGTSILFTENMSSSVIPFTLTGTINLDTPFFGLGNDDFRGEIFLVQRNDLPQAAPQSPVAITSSRTNGQISISWQVDSNYVWYVQENLSLVNSAGWVDLVGPLSATNSTLETSIIPTNVPIFYRLIYRAE